MDLPQGYVLTKHAKEVMEKRQIQLEWVEHVLFAPELIEPDSIDPELEHRLAHIAEFGGRVLRVIVNTRAIPARVVTVFFDRRR